MAIDRQGFWNAVWWAGVAGFIVSWLAAGLLQLMDRDPTPAIGGAALATILLGVGRRRRR